MVVWIITVEGNEPNTNTIGSFPTKEAAEKQVERLQSAGVNSARIMSMELNDTFYIDATIRTARLKRL